MHHQLKLMDSKCKLLFANPEQIWATSGRIILGPQTKTPISDPSHSDRISTMARNILIIGKFYRYYQLTIDMIINMHA